MNLKQWLHHLDQRNRSELRRMCRELLGDLWRDHEARERSRRNQRVIEVLTTEGGASS